MWALFMDALTHDGPADPARIDRAVCLQPFMPAVTPESYARDAPPAFAALGTQPAGYPRADVEPALAGYATAAGCPAAAAARPRCAPRRGCARSVPRAAAHRHPCTFWTFQVQEVHPIRRAVRRRPRAG